MLVLGCFSISDANVVVVVVLIVAVVLWASKTTMRRFRLTDVCVCVREYFVD